MKRLIQAAMIVESIIISFSIRHEMMAAVMIGALFVIGLKMTDRVWNE